MGVFRDVLPVYLRRHDVSLAAIGWITGLYAAWSLKFLWSPLVDRFGERRLWIAAAMVAMASALALMSRLEPTDLDSLRPDSLLWWMIAGYCLSSATQDVAIDAYTIGIVDRGEEGPANAMRITAYRVALVAAGGGLLLLPRWIEWHGTFLFAAGLSLLMAGAVFLCPRVAVPLAARRVGWRSLRRWLGRSGALPMLAFVLLYRLGDLGMGPMVKPLWVDRGFSDEEIGLVNASLGALCTVVGAWLGAGFVSRYGIGSGLLVLGVFALLSNLGYAAAAALPEAGALAMYAASLVESLCAGLASAAFLSFLMRICEKDHAAVQYALLTSLYALPGAFAGMASGWLTERLDYAAYFALTAAIALPAFGFLPAARRWAADGPEA